MALILITCCEQSLLPPPAAACSLGSRVSCSPFCLPPSAAMTLKPGRSARKTRRSGGASQHLWHHFPCSRHRHRGVVHLTRSRATGAVSQAASAVTTPIARRLVKSAPPPGSACARRGCQRSAVARAGQRPVFLPIRSRATQTAVNAVLGTGNRPMARFLVAPNACTWWTTGPSVAPTTVRAGVPVRPARSTPSATAISASVVRLAAAASDREPDNDVHSMVLRVAVPLPHMPPPFLTDLRLP
jgi:hypothetical protein